MNQVITPKVRPCVLLLAFGRGLFGFPLFSCRILIDACALDGVGKGKAFSFTFEEIWGKSVLEAEPFEWRENTKFKNVLCCSSSSKWDDEAAFLLFITGKLHLHLLISLCSLFVLWFLGVLITILVVVAFGLFWKRARKTRSHHLCFSKLLFVIVSVWGLDFKCQAGPVSTNSKWPGLFTQRE